MKTKMVLLTKDAMCREYLPVYGNMFWKTPNIDALAANGTVYHNYYAAAPSTIMAFYSMLTGKFAHETEIMTYKPAKDMYCGSTVLDKLHKAGYSCHIFWDSFWNEVLNHTYVYGKDTILHNTMNTLRQPVGAHYIHDGFLKSDDELAETTLAEFIKQISTILDAEENTFLWIHLPHVLNGKVSYGSDIELFDKYVGAIRHMVGDNNIILTADHGNMNGLKGKLCYGFDVYQNAINIPLITPKRNGLSNIYDNTSSVDLDKIILGEDIPQREFCYSDSAYYVQPNRKLAIIHNNYKYIYNKATKTEELYDLNFDPTERFSIMTDYEYDVDRHIKAPSRELYFYPNWNEVDEIRKEMRDELKRVWRNASFRQDVMNRGKNILRILYERSSVFRKKI